MVWHKRDKEIFYFDTYGIQPPQNLIRYLKDPIVYNTESLQPKDQVFCGHVFIHVEATIVMKQVVWSSRAADKVCPRPRARTQLHRVFL